MARLKEWRWLAFALGAVICLGPWASPGLALALGATLALLLDNPLAHEGKQLSKWLLQACVILLGFSMDLHAVIAAGREGVLFAAVTIVTTFALGTLIGRWLKIRRMISMLVSAGTAICGGSAIAAVGAATDADEGDMTVAIGTIFLLNAVALYVFPPLGHMLHMNSTQFGTWSGIAIHDISSVVGAASHYSNEALQTATAVKLSRSLWIVPVTAIAAYVIRRAQTKNECANKTPGRRLQIPWFIGLFLLASVIRTMNPAVAAATPHISHLATMGFTLTLFLIGAGLSMKTVRAVGWRPLVQGAMLWAFISCASVGAILWLM